MSTDVHPGYDALVVLALQQADAATRVRLTAHLTQCDICRGRYATIDAQCLRAVATAPAVAPPAGFAGRVLADLGIDERTGRAHPQRPVGVLAVAAALFVGMVLGVGGATMMPTDPPVLVGPRGSTPAAALRTASGEEVGTVGVTEIAGRAHVVVTVSGASGENYTCVVVGADGARHEAGRWEMDTLRNGTSAWGTWMADLPAAPQRIELVTPSGKVWAKAEF